MKKLKTCFIRFFLIFLIIIPIASFAHFMFFPQETRSLLIDFSDFQKEGRLYFNDNTPASKIDSLQQFVEEAS